MLLSTPPFVMSGKDGTLIKWKPMGTDFSNIDADIHDKIFELKTPCYIIDEERLGENVNKLKNSFVNGWDSDVIFGYSVKTNSLPWILTFMKNEGFLAEVVSEQEYRLARLLGFTPEQIILNGPVKSENGLIEALNEGAYVNLDNFHEIEVVKESLDLRSRTWKVGLRYNFHLEDVCPRETVVGKEYSRFGFNVENGDFEKAVKLVGSIEGVEFVGLHGHNSTRTKSLNIFNAIAMQARQLVDKYNLKLAYLDIGGGFFGDKPGVPEYSEYVSAIRRGFVDDKNVKLIIEPGASLVSSPLSYLCSVANVRNVAAKRFVTLDGSTIHIDPMMHGINFQKKIYFKHSKREVDSRETIPDDKSDINVTDQTLCGFTCIEMDRIGTIENEQPLSAGDKIEFLNCGSYSMALSPLFIGYFPTVYVKNRESEYRAVRRAWDERIFISNCEVEL